MIMLAFIVITMGIVVINNLLHKYWKPVPMVKFFDPSYTPRFVTPEEDAANKK